MSLYKAQTDTDVIGGSSFLRELKNLNQLFSGVGEDFRQFLEKYWSVLDSVKRIFFSETSSTQFMCDEFSANYPFKLILISGKSFMLIRKVKI